LKPKKSSKPMLETKYDGEDLPHRLMWVVVEEQAELAKTREGDWSIPSLAAMVFAFLAMEAYLNYVGLRLAPEIWEKEREHFRTTGFKGKLREVMDTAGLNWEPGKRPIQTVLGLEKLRNAIAHGRPERRAGKILHAEGTEPPYPAFSLRSMFTPKSKMPKAVHDVEQLANGIHIAAKPRLKAADVLFGREAFRGPLSYNSRETLRGS
jgi:hypothetical protein